MKGITLVYDEKRAALVREEIVPLFHQHLKRTVAFKAGLQTELDEDSFIVTYLSDELLKEFFNHCH